MGPLSIVKRTHRHEDQVVSDKNQCHKNRYPHLRLVAGENKFIDNDDAGILCFCHDLRGTAQLEMRTGPRDTPAVLELLRVIPLRSLPGATVALPR